MVVMNIILIIIYSNSHLLQKNIMWYSSIPRVNTFPDLRASTISLKEQASTFSTKIYMAHNNLSLVRTQYQLHVPHCGTNDPPSPSNGQ